MQPANQILNQSRKWRRLDYLITILAGRKRGGIIWTQCSIILVNNRCITVWTHFYTFITYILYYHTRSFLNFQGLNATSLVKIINSCYSALLRGSTKRNVGQMHSPVSRIRVSFIIQIMNMFFALTFSQKTCYKVIIFLLQGLSLPFKTVIVEGLVHVM